MHELRKECQELKEALESAKYALEEETLTRVDLENKLQSAKEELSFKKQMHEKVGGCCVLKFPWTNKKVTDFFMEHCLSVYLPTQYWGNESLKWQSYSAKGCWRVACLITFAPMHSHRLWTVQNIRRVDKSQVSFDCVLYGGWVRVMQVQLSFSFDQDLRVYPGWISHWCIATCCSISGLDWTPLPDEGGGIKKDLCRDRLQEQVWRDSLGKAEWDEG